MLTMTLTMLASKENRRSVNTPLRAKHHLRSFLCTCLVRVYLLTSPLFLPGSPFMSFSSLHLCYTSYGTALLHNLPCVQHLLTCPHRRSAVAAPAQREDAEHRLLSATNRGSTLPLRAREEEPQRAQSLMHLSVRKPHR